MSIRRLVVETDPSSMNVAEFCRLHGISTWFFWSLRRRFACEGEAALEPRSRAPKRVANRTSAEVEDAIVAVRKRLGEEGWDAGPGSIHDDLVAAGPLSRVPSEATIWRVLSRRGFITPQPAKRPTTTGRRFQAARANECWQIDDTGWALADGTEVKIINVLDDRSRLAPASMAVTSCTGAAAFDAITAGAAHWGWPERILCDNASAFRYTLADALSALGVGAGHARPYHPQTCGKVERFHQTLKRFLAAQDPAPTQAELQTQLDAFRDHYNHHRPHRALGRGVPAQVWADSPRSGPAPRALTAPSAIYRVTVGAKGTAYAGHRSGLGLTHAQRRYAIALGVAHAGQTATVVITGLACHVFIDGRLIRHLTLDPTRQRQPLHRRLT